MSDLYVQEPDEDGPLQEMASLFAIFPNTVFMNFQKRSGRIEVPVKLDQEIEIILQGEFVGDMAKWGGEYIDGNHKESGHYGVRIRHLPSMVLEFKLPDGYPEIKGPEFEFKAPFVQHDKLKEMETSLYSLWESYRDFVLFSMIDHLQTLVETKPDTIFGAKINLEDDLALFLTLKDFNEAAIQREFDGTSFDCDICQNTYKGKDCTKFSPCSHVYCSKCLSAYFGELIEAGEVEKVNCPNVQCIKQFKQARENLLKKNEVLLKENFDFMKYKDDLLTFPVNRSTLIRVFRHEYDNKRIDTLVQRYFQIFTKKRYEILATIFPNRVATCPRKRCETLIPRGEVDDLLVRCPRCKYSFCYRCSKVWHGSFVICDRVADRLDDNIVRKWLENDENSRERYILLNTYGKCRINQLLKNYEAEMSLKELLDDPDAGLHRCPGCDMLIEKSEGCNKMTCPKCDTKYCYRCKGILDPVDPYRHYSDPGSECYARCFNVPS